tara:strand:+ start:486 stop:2108 length:1623 start_codon:yes stop_codon:yes gene_type:complete
MSSSIESAFKVLSTNNGEPDNTLTLRNLLIRRFRTFEQSDEEITIDDLLSTHNLFLSSSFKPFISTSSVYLKSILPHINLGSYMTIDLDQVFKGDFIHDMYLDVVFNPIGDPNNTEQDALKYRYTPYPGIRLIKKLELWLNGRKVDSYNQEDMLFYMNNELETEKKEAFKKCVGHSGYNQSYYYSNDREHEEVRHVIDGYQTFKNYHEKLHMTIPLLFWFNKYLEKSYPVLKQDTVAISNSRNHIKIWFSPLDDIIQTGYYDNDSGIVDETTDKTPYFNTHTLSHAMNNLNATKPTYDMSMFVNNIYVNDEVRNFYIKNVDMYMVSTHQSFNLNIHKLDEIKIKDLEDMTPYLYFAFRTEENEKSFHNWYKFTRGQRKWFPIPVYNGHTITQNNNNNKIIIYEGQKPTTTNVFILALKRSYYDIEHPIINEFTLNFDTLPFIVQKNPSDYIKYKAQQKDDNYHYSYDNNGIYLLQFCRKFTDEEATGHINFSRIQEIILKYTVDPAVAGQKMKLYMSAKRINMLSINDNDVNLRWSSYMA